MFGGVPDQELQELSAFWEAFPGLKETLFTSDNGSYCQLNVPNLKAAVGEHPSVAAFLSHYEEAFRDFADALQRELLDNITLHQREHYFRHSGGNICYKDCMAVVLHQCETGVPVYGGITDIEQLKQNLEENCIPEDFVEMGIEDYPRFLERRRVLMSQKIRRFYEALK